MFSRLSNKQAIYTLTPTVHNNSRMSTRPTLLRSVTRSFTSHAEGQHLHLRDSTVPPHHGYLPPPRPLHVLIVDGYTKESRQGLVDHNVPLAGDLYTRMILASAPVPAVLAKWYACDAPGTLDPDSIPLVAPHTKENERETGKQSFGGEKAKSGSENFPTELSLGWHGLRTGDIDRESFVFVGDYDSKLYSSAKQRAAREEAAAEAKKSDLEYIESFPRCQLSRRVAYSPHVSVCTLDTEQLMAALPFFDAVAWTGCSLSAYSDDPNVKKQIALAKKAFQLGIPQYGSCWAAQVAVVATGGKVGKSPKGREMGVGRRIELTREGLRHPMYKGRRGVFDAFESHDDEITAMPPGGINCSASILASNGHSVVQALEVRVGKGAFWAHQYHPEYSLFDVAMLMFARMQKLVEQGHFTCAEEGYKYVRGLLELHERGDCKDLSYKMGLHLEDFAEHYRYAECRNWIAQLVMPFYRSRH